MDKIKTLIVDGDKNYLASCEKLLNSNILDVWTLDDGEKALSTYANWQPQIIVMDIHLPHMSGYKILQKIRNEHRDVSTTVIIATSVSDKADIMDCLKLGIQGYMVKPFKTEELGVKIFECYLRQHPEQTQELERLRQVS